MTLVHAIGRILVCLFIVGYGVGGIAHAAEPPNLGKWEDMIKTVFSFVTDMTEPGRYLRAGYGQDLRTNVDGTIDFRTLNNGDGSLKTKRAPVYSVASGARTSWGRLEGEFSYRENEIEHFNYKQPTNPIDEMDGGLTTFAFMINLFWELEFQPIKEKEFFIIPYAGGGFGGAYVEYTEKNLLNALDSKYQESESKEGKANFAYQGGGGVRFPIGKRGPEGSGFSFDASYRFFGTPKMKFDLMQGSPEARSVEFKNDHHTWMVGLVYDF